MDLWAPNFDFIDEIDLADAASWLVEGEAGLSRLALTEVLLLEPAEAQGRLEEHLEAAAVGRRALDFQRQQLADGVRPDEALARCRQIVTWLAPLLADAAEGLRAYPAALSQAPRDDSYKLAYIAPIVRDTVFPPAR